MNCKLLNLGIIISSLFGYLEWGTDQSMFLFEAELDILTKLFTDPLSIIHPFTVLPLLGQILLIITLFQQKPSKKLSFIGLACISLLLLMICFVGIISSNFKIVGSTIPFIILGILAIRCYLKKTS